MDAEQTKAFEDVIAKSQESEDNSDLIEPEAPPLENLGDIDDLADEIKDPVDSKDVKDTVDDDANSDDVDDDKPPEEDVPSPEDEQLVRFAVETYGVDPQHAANLQKAGLLVETLQNTAAKRSPEEEPKPEEEKDLLDGINLEDVDEDVAKVLTGLSDQLKAGNLKHKELEAAIASIQEKELLVSQGDREKEFDSMIEGVEGYDEILGEGGTIALPQNSKHFRNREMVWNQILLSKEISSQRNLPSLTPKVEMQRALASLFPEHQKKLSDKLARDEINAKLKNGASSHTVRPTGVTGEDIPDGDEKAKAALVDRHREITGS